MAHDPQRFHAARSYDGVAHVYESVLAPRLFDGSARALVAAAAPSAGDRILDVGSGTGAVARAARLATRNQAHVVAVDPSIDMLLAARRGGIEDAVVGSLPHLPIASDRFDVVLCAFVLTHVDDADAAVVDMARVLRRGGRVGVSAWAAGDDEFTAAWGEVVRRYADAESMTLATSVVLPGDARFSQPNGVADVLRGAGLADVRTNQVELEFKLTVEEFIEGREACASGRALRAVLTDADWHRFRRDVRTTLTARFPHGVAYRRGVFIATAVAR